MVVRLDWVTHNVTTRRRVALVFSHYGVYGGAEIWAAQTAEALARRHEVVLRWCGPMDRGRFLALAGSDLPGVTIEPLRERVNVAGYHPRSWRAARTSGAVIADGADALIVADLAIPPPSPVRDAMLYVHFPIGRRATVEGRSAKERAGRMLAHAASRETLRSYRVTANSAYTQRWIAERWKVRSGVLAPPRSAPLGTAHGGLVGKERLIVVVGRIDPAKRVEELAAAYRSAIAGTGSTVDHGWRLRFVGSASSESERACAARLAATPGVEVLVDASREQLLDSLKRASVLWHAKGLGVDESLEPERLEHFGMGVVEAMAAGCVPIVHGRGGPAEIVRPGVDGAHFVGIDGDDGLIATTLRIIENPAALRSLGLAAMNRAASYPADDAYAVAVESVLFARSR